MNWYNASSGFIFSFDDMYVDSQQSIQFSDTSTLTSNIQSLSIDQQHHSPTPSKWITYYSLMHLYLNFLGENNHYFLDTFSRIGLDPSSRGKYACTCTFSNLCILFLSEGIFLPSLWCHIWKCVLVIKREMGFRQGIVIYHRVTDHKCTFT